MKNARVVWMNKNWRIVESNGYSLEYVYQRDSVGEPQWSKCHAAPYCGSADLNELAKAIVETLCLRP